MYFIRSRSSVIKKKKNSTKIHVTARCCFALNDIINRQLVGFIYACIPTRSVHFWESSTCAECACESVFVCVVSPGETGGAAGANPSTLGRGDRSNSGETSSHSNQCLLTCTCVIYMPASLTKLWRKHSYFVPLNHPGWNFHSQVSLVKKYINTNNTPYLSVNRKI